MVATVLRFTKAGDVKTPSVSQHFGTKISNIKVTDIPDDIPSHLMPTVNRARQKGIEIKMAEGEVGTNRIRYITCAI